MVQYSGATNSNPLLQKNNIRFITMLMIMRAWKMIKSCRLCFVKRGCLVRVPSRGLKKIGRAVSMRKHEGKEEALELCKKRIIMGKKCRPLNVSGALHYDKNGVLVPEDFIFSPSNHSL
ncbi:hypothetical protein L1987_59931 [Smallanthus sonchifolius]|uniref:Uncharacterized protein n=1 Tax=Smallanthus sonchifolius TaxID=185202 RepID=A0ACB9D702_9ASTR|nr:hypothetical protein L1987_59931 [Smallanthus sonchifolius]